MKILLKQPALNGMGESGNDSHLCAPARQHTATTADQARAVHNHPALHTPSLPYTWALLSRNTVECIRHLRSACQHHSSCVNKKVWTAAEGQPQRPSPELRQCLAACCQRGCSLRAGQLGNGRQLCSPRLIGWRVILQGMQGMQQRHKTEVMRERLDIYET